MKEIARKEFKKIHYEIYQSYSLLHCVQLRDFYQYRLYDGAVSKIQPRAISLDTDDLTLGMFYQTAFNQISYVTVDTGGAVESWYLKPRFKQSVWVSGYLIDVLRADKTYPIDDRQKINLSTLGLLFDLSDEDKVFYRLATPQSYSRFIIKIV